MEDSFSSVQSPISPTDSSSNGSRSARSRHRKRSWSHIQRNLPGSVCDWTRKHAADFLHVQYSECFSAHSELVQKMGQMGGLTEEEHQCLEIVNRHFILNSPISAYVSGLRDSVEEDLEIFCSEIEKLDNLVNNDEANNNPYMFVLVSRLKEFYGELRLLYQKIERVGGNHAYLYEGVFKEFACVFARLCYLRVERCSKVDRVVWNDIYGATVSSQPDLRFYKQGFDIEFSNKCVSVVTEAKPVLEEDEDSPLKRCKKTFNTDHDSMDSSSSSDNITPLMKRRKKTFNRDLDSLKSTSFSDNVALDLHDKVLGQHAGELLLELHSLYADKVDNLEQEKLSMVGVIIKQTRVFFTLLEMSSKHYKKIKDGVELNEEDQAMIYYSAGRNILEVKERKTLIEDFVTLNNIEG